MGPKHFALLNLIDLNESASQKQLAKRLSLELSGLVRTIDELEQEGTVDRQQAPDDRRRYALALISSGTIGGAQGRQPLGAQRSNTAAFNGAYPVSGDRNLAEGLTRCGRG
ncbi:MAG: MarR family transcriptional regulator [Solirubrobacteraceae bacterium]